MNTYIRTPNLNMVITRLGEAHTQVPMCDGLYTLRPASDTIRRYSPVEVGVGLLE